MVAIKGADEFVLEGSAEPAAEVPKASRRRQVPRIGGSPWPWVAMATALIAAAVMVSPGQRPDPDPPAMAWTVRISEGRAPQVWVVESQALVTTATGVTALDVTTGDRMWSVPLEDPACTEIDNQLTCVHGAGEDAAIATMTTGGDIVADRLFPGADVAHQLGDDLLVGGQDPEQDGRWLGRYGNNEGWPGRWLLDSGDLGDNDRWQTIMLSQGVVTISDRVVDENFDGDAMAADLDTGAAQPAVQRRVGGYSVSGIGPGGQTEFVMPLDSGDVRVPGHPDAVVGRSGVYTGAGGEELLELAGLPVVALGDDVIASVVDQSRWRPGRFATTIERVDVPTGESRWRLPRSAMASCPCALSEDSLVLTQASRGEQVEAYGPVPVVDTLLNVDPETGEHRWALPISSIPEALATQGNQTVVLIDGDLTAYTDR
ncbi:hypothetical protein [Ruania rhizosphaerae]|uniref:hypothetical protein n=1 Tax=Ruania rhizosphaerae TaxID=1840413 RepID=UPI00135682D7|nr:hypothetical protein [Ruania rhizosphaerae]